MEFLDGKGIETVVLKYLKKRAYPYALMIDGEWGSGKTYFVENDLIPAITAAKEGENSIPAPVYFSLYGVQSTNELQSSIFYTLLERSQEEKHSPLSKVTPFSKYAVEFVSKAANECVSKDSLEKLIQRLSKISIKDFLLIFDDLERCNADINSIFGLINNFVEHQGCHVIIIANQKEIGKACSNNNIELKYLVAELDQLRTPKTENSKMSPSPLSKSDASNQDLSKLAKSIFSENIDYDQIKEKLIGQTVYYRPSIQDVIPQIVQSFFKEIPSEHRDSIIEKASEILLNCECYNIRTLQFSFHMFDPIYSCINKQSYGDSIKIKAISALLDATLKISILYKDLNHRCEWENDGEYGHVTLDGNIFSPKYHTLSFRFLHDYIYDSSLDVAQMDSVLHSYMEQLDHDEKNQLAMVPLNKLANFETMDDEQVQEAYNELYVNLSAHKYNSYYFRWILSLSYKLTSTGLPLTHTPCEIFDLLSVEISSGKKLCQDYGTSMMAPDDSMYDKYKQDVNKLFELDKQVNVRKTSDSFERIFDSVSDWGTQFLSFCNEHNNVFLTDKSFFSRIDLDRCLHLIRASSIQELNAFREALASVYNFSNLSDYYANDVDSLKHFHKSLSDPDFLKESPPSHMKQWNIDLICKLVDSILQNLEHPNS